MALKVCLLQTCFASSVAEHTWKVPSIGWQTCTVYEYVCKSGTLAWGIKLFAV